MAAGMPLVVRPECHQGTVISTPHPTQLAHSLSGEGRARLQPAEAVTARAKLTSRSPMAGAVSLTTSWARTWKMVATTK